MLYLSYICCSFLYYGKNNEICIIGVCYLCCIQENNGKIERSLFAKK